MRIMFQGLEILCDNDYICLMHFPNRICRIHGTSAGCTARASGRRAFSRDRPRLVAEVPVSCCLGKFAAVGPLRPGGCRWLSG